METLMHILASFDVFQVVISAFPGLFAPVVHAFRDIFLLLYHSAAEQFEAHPGILSAGIIFLSSYGLWSGWRKLRTVRLSDGKSR